MASVAATASSAALRKCYLDNLAALYVSDPALAARIEAVPFAQLPALEPTRDGNYTVRLATDDGKTVYAHSRYAPLEEARTLVTSQMDRTHAQRQARKDPATTHPLEPKVQPDATEDSEPGGLPDLPEDPAEMEGLCFYVAGCGLGYHIAELTRRFLRPLVIVAEDDLRLLKAALCVTDFAEPLRDRRMTFIAAADKDLLHERLHSAEAAMMLGLTFIVLPCTARVHKAFHGQSRALLRDFVAYARVQVYTLLRLSRTTVRNILMNLPPYLAGPGVEVLEGRGRGYPAILVAAGPSLARNVEQLRALRGRAVIIAVQTVYKMLLARGIPPHIVCSLDYHEVSSQFFHDVPNTGGSLLVAEPKAHHRVLEAFAGRKLVLDSGFATNLLREAAPRRGALRAGSTVAHLAFYLAEYLGCDPILLVGQDLSYTDGLYYPAGTQIERIWRPEMGRLTTIEMKQWERIARARANARQVKDIHGNDAYTEEAMFVYAEQFQADFAQTRARVIHATEGGMRLAGTEVMTLRDAADQFCTRDLPANLLDVPLGRLEPAFIADVRAAILERKREIEEIRQIALETGELLQRMARLVERPPEFNRLMPRIDELRTRMNRNARTFDLVRTVSQYAELRRLSADRAIHDEGPETPARTRRRLRRDREYVDAIVEGCDYLLGLLPAALARIDGANA